MLRFKKGKNPCARIFVLQSVCFIRIWRSTMQIYLKHFLPSYAMSMEQACKDDVEWHGEYKSLSQYHIIFFISISLSLWCWSTFFLQNYLYSTDMMLIFCYLSEQKQKKQNSFNKPWQKTKPKQNKTIKTTTMFYKTISKVLNIAYLFICLSFRANTKQTKQL